MDACGGDRPARGAWWRAVVAAAVAVLAFGAPSVARAQDTGLVFDDLEELPEADPDPVADDAAGSDRAPWRSSPCRWTSAAT